jgi:hypothetical protein
MSEKKTRQTVSKARDRRILNYILIALAVLVVGGLLAFGGWRSYQLWKTKRAITNSRQFLERKDYGQAWVSAGRAVQLDRNNVEAIRLMAEAAEAEGRDNKVRGKADASARIAQARGRIATGRERELSRRGQGRYGGQGSADSRGSSQQAE